LFNFASKVLSLFIEPASLIFILLVVALLLRKLFPRVARVAQISAVLVLYILSCPAFSHWLVGTLEEKNPDRGVLLTASAQAIVVLGGALRLPDHVHPLIGITNSSDRVLLASRLYRAGKAPLVVVSGGDNPLVAQRGSLHEADAMRDLLVEWGVPATAILVEGGSTNTHENALFTCAILAPKKVNHILLVTSAMHMPRAQASFQKVGFNTDIAPADFNTGWGSGLVLFKWVPTTGALAISNEAIHEWAGLVVYKLRGWI